MMIDDVVFTQAGASNVLVPYIDPVPQNNTGKQRMGYRARNLLDLPP